jgi:hypothetical protein
VDNPSALVDPAAFEGVHPEVAVHLSYNHNQIDTTIDTDLEGGPLRFSVGVSGAYDIRPEPMVDFSYRVAPELLLKAYGLSLSSVFYAGFAERGNGLRHQPAMLGMLAEVSYILWRRLELSGRYAFVDIDDDVLGQSRDRAQSQVAAIRGDIDDLRAAEVDPVRRTELDNDIAALEDDITALEKVGAVDRDHELTFGINVFIIGTSLRWQNDLSWLFRETANGDRDDFRFRSQLTLQF